MIRTLILTAAVMAGLTTSTSTAQAQGGFGIGFGGRGVGVYVGRGGGWGGYYGQGGYYGPGYYGGPRVYTGSGYYGPSYYGGTGTNYSSPYYAPSSVYSGSTVVTPDVPSGLATPMFDGGSIVLMNPATNSNSIEYMLNGERFVMRPGQSHRFTHDRDWIVEFDRGDGGNFVQYSLKSATYKFKPATQGWELFEQAASRPAPSALPPAPNSKLIDQPQPANQVPPPIPDSEEPKPRELTSPSNAPETIIRPRTATKSGSSEKLGPQLTN